MKKLSPEVLAYCAGVIDSDGYIGIKRSDYAMRVRGDAGQAIYAERIAVKQVQPEAVRLLSSVFGGGIRQEKSSADHGKPLYVWGIHSLSAGRAIAALAPYLRIKRKQADNAINLRALIGQGRRWPVPTIVNGEPMVTATEFASLTGASPASVFQAARLGSIPSVRHGRSRMIPASFAEAYKSRLAVGGHAPRQQDITAKMESLYQKAKLLNKVGV